MMGKLYRPNYRELDQSYAGCRPIYSYDIDHSDRITPPYKYTHGNCCRSLDSDVIDTTNYNLDGSRINPSVIRRHVVEIDITHNRRIVIESPYRNNSCWFRHSNLHEWDRRSILDEFFS